MTSEDISPAVTGDAVGAGPEESACGEALGISSYSQALAAGLICLWLQPETRRATKRIERREKAAEEAVSLV
ncbi:MAG: hypothetical protein J6T99_07725, partial [Oscillospiraceae bacterium]|nr:hypothetical protein [Oscillospiraceae bacterium]